MFLVVVIAMYITSSAILTKDQHGSLRQSAEDRRAEEAARSGLDYAQARLEENPDWRGDGDGLIVNTPSLMVREERGNVVGVLTTSDGGRAQFRIRFNHQDGTAGTDALPDPNLGMQFDSPHVSVNNVLGTSKTELPLGDGPNHSCQGTVTSYPVPAYTAAIVCEGRVFNDLSMANDSNLNPPARRLESSRVIEAFFRVSDLAGEARTQDALAMAGGDVALQLFPNADASQRVSMTSFQGNDPAHFRGRGNISATDAAGNPALIDGPDAHLLMLGDKTLQARLGSGVQRGAEDVNGDFYKVAWAEAGTTSPDASNVPAGVYVYWQSDQSLHYYDKNYEQYLSDIKLNPMDPGRVVGALPEGMTFVKKGTQGPDGVTSSKHRFVITKDVRIQESANAKDFTIMPRAGAKEDLSDRSDGAVGPLAERLGLEESASLPEILAAMSGAELEQHGTLHQLLQGMAESASIEVETSLSLIRDRLQFGDFGDFYDDGGGGYGNDQLTGSVTWSASSIVGQNLDGGAVLRLLATGGAVTLTDVSEPNLNVLSPTGVPGTYRLKDDALARLLFGASSSALSELDLESLSGGAVSNGAEPLGPRDFEVTLAPQSEQGVRVVAPGDIRIAADVRGSGASISAHGDIRLIGVGFELDAANGEQGTDVSLYSTQNIIISTLRKRTDDEYAFAGLDLRGVLYSWGNIDLLMSHPDENSSFDPQRVKIQGTMVAYGGQPGNQPPGTWGGNITIKADQIDLVFDPSYLLGISNGEGYSVTLAPLSQSYRQ
jgi:hypothetical protein